MDGWALEFKWSFERQSDWEKGAVQLYGQIKRLDNSADPQILCLTDTNGLELQLLIILQNIFRQVSFPLTLEARSRPDCSADVLH